ncbi:hypothetical protein BGX34_008748 [Mortierella sp. NVP85]|nr:hypothetical protein BGX34_008748 [Mortierella sp. NVP85]
MSIVSKNDLFSQAFTTYPSTPSSGIIYVPTRSDGNTGQRVVLWDDIKRHFKHAEALTNGNDRVLFIGSGSHDELPLRIAHHPGLVLEVIMSGGSSGNSQSRQLSLTSGSENPFSESAMILLNQSLVVRSQGQVTLLESHAMQPAAVHRQQEVASFPAITSGQEYQTPAIENYINGNSVSLPQAMNQQELLQEIQRLRTQNEFIRVVQNRVQVLLARTYELREHPVPRLFVILPKPMINGPQGRSTSNLPADRFRLYFLCECGEHTMADTLHMVHMARHEGYDLDKPRDFFEEYGSYLLTMMYMVKCGVIAGGVVVPSFDNTDTMNELESLQRDLGGPNKSIGSLIDDTIGFIRNLIGGTVPGSESDAQAEHRVLKALQGVDLKEMASYLLPKSKGTLGNLYRMVTPEGHVKWVCREHYRSMYQDSTARQFQDILKANDGALIEETGNIVIKLMEKTLASQFYNSMVEVQGIQELEIALKWNANMEDLQAFARAVTMANVLHLAVDCSFIENTWHHLGSSDSRFDPILQLASNGRIQSLEIKCCPDFFARVGSPSSLTMAPRLRVLVIDGKVPFDTGYSFLRAILDKYIGLTELDLHLDGRYRKCWSAPDIIQGLRSLEVLKLDYEYFSTRVVICRGTIQSAEMWIMQLCDLLPKDLEFACAGHLDLLVVENTPQASDERRLADILKQNPRIKNLNIGCVGARSHIIIDLVISTRTEAVKKNNTFTRCRFELKEERLAFWDDDRHFDAFDHVTSMIVFPANSSEFTMRTRYIMRNPFKFLEGFYPDTTGDFILKYGWSLETFRAPSSFSNRHAELLNIVTELKGSQLKMLNVDPTNLNDSGRNYLRRVLKRSEQLDTPKMRSWATKWKFEMDGWEVEE